ncbi:3-oxoacyl-ACP reductase FabG [Frateuria aurantia]
MAERILVTGSSRGIGRAIALRLAAAGFDLSLHCRHRSDEAAAVAETIRALGREVDVLQFDVGDRVVCREVLTAEVARHGAYYGVVCNAGLSRDGTFAGMSGDDWDLVMRTNLDGFHHVLQPLILPMVQRRRGGRIVCITSVSGQIGQRGQVNYSAAKAGLVGAAKALALELASRHITVNCVAPGLIDTEMLEGHGAIEEILAAIPARRMGTADEVAAAVAFLMGPDAAYITRQVLAVNGGLC